MIMDYDRELFECERILKNTEKDLNAKFENLGPEDIRYIDKVLDTIFLLKLDGKKDLQYKVHLMLFLNTSTGCRSKLEEDKIFGHLVGKFPTLSKTLYFRLVLKLNLQSHLKALIMYGCPAICMEIVQLINDELRYIPLQERLDMLELVLNGLYSVISRELSSNSDISVINKLYNQFQMVCLHFNYCMSIDKNIKDVSRCIGIKLMTFLKLLRSFLYRNLNDVKIELPDIETSTDLTEATNERTIADVYDIVAGKCGDCIKQLDINLMLHWHEIDYTSDITLQKAIGENAYRLWETLKQKENVTNTVSLLIQLLPVILVKPEEKIDLTNLSIYEILQMIESGSESSSICMKALLTKSDIFKSEKFINMLRDHVSDFDAEIIEEVFVILYSEILKESDETSGKKLKDLLMFVMKSTSIDNFTKSINILSKIQEQRELIKIDENEVRHKLLKIDQLLSNPVTCKSSQIKEEILREFFVYAFMNSYGFLFELMNCVRHRVGCWETIIEVLNVIKPVYSRVPYDEQPDIPARVVIFTMKSFKDFSAREILPIIKFVEIAKELEFINLDSMLWSLLPLLQPCNYPHKHSIMENYLSICAVLIERSIYTRDLDYMYALGIAQIMDHSRWTTDDFASDKVDLRTQAIKLINIVISHLKEYIGEDQDCKKRWLISHVDKLSNCTKSYFTFLFPNFETYGLEARLFLLIHGIKTRFTDEDRLELSVILSKVLSTSTYEELHLMVMNYVWADPAESQRHAFFIFRSICDGVLLLKILRERTVNLEKYNKCFQNVIHVVTKLVEAVYVPLISNSDDNILQVINLNKFLLAVSKDLPNCLRFRISFNVIKILSDVLAMMEDSIDYNIKTHLNLAFVLASNIA